MITHLTQMPEVRKIAVDNRRDLFGIVVSFRRAPLRAHCSIVPPRPPKSPLPRTPVAFAPRPLEPPRNDILNCNIAANLTPGAPELGVADFLELLRRKHQYFSPTLCSVTQISCIVTRSMTRYANRISKGDCQFRPVL